jgi:hypothetical protein
VSCVFWGGLNKTKLQNKTKISCKQINKQTNPHTHTILDTTTSSNL